jgi:hypothetical protein
MDPHADSFGSRSYCIRNTDSGANSNSLSEPDSHSYPYTNADTVRDADSDSVSSFARGNRFWHPD